MLSKLSIAERISLSVLFYTIILFFINFGFFTVVGIELSGVIPIQDYVSGAPVLYYLIGPIAIIIIVLMPIGQIKVLLSQGAISRKAIAVFGLIFVYSSAFYYGFEPFRGHVHQLFSAVRVPSVGRDDVIGIGVVVFIVIGAIAFLYQQYSQISEFTWRWLRPSAVAFGLRLIIAALIAFLLGMAWSTYQARSGAIVAIFWEKGCVEGRLVRAASTGLIVFMEANKKYEYFPLSAVRRAIFRENCSSVSR